MAKELGAIHVEVIAQLDIIGRKASLDGSKGPNQDEELSFRVRRAKKDSILIFENLTTVREVKKDKK